MALKYNKDRTIDDNAVRKKKSMEDKRTEKKELPVEEECKPLTDEEFKEYQEKDARTTNKVLRFFKAIWEAVNFFGT